MINIEKLSLFNMDKFKILYDTLEDSYICDKNFFDIYNNESFLIKYIIRKQVKLFKLNNKYIGYVWHEYPESSEACTIYGMSFKDEFIDYLPSNLLSSLKFSSMKLDIIENRKNEIIMNRFNFDILARSIVMKLSLSSSSINKKPVPNNIQFKHFKLNRDEKLRCDLQNNIFKDKNRIPLKINDIYEEEREEYFINEFCVFLCNKNGQALGYGQIILTKNQYTIVNFGILEQFRRNGYGEILLRYLIDLCRISSINDVYIRVDENNYKAINLYKKIGFSKSNCCITWKKDFF